MFTSKSKSSPEENAGCSIIAQGTIITGDIESNGDIRLDGLIKGNIRSKARIIIGANALVEGNVHSKDADIFGHVKGNLNIAELLQLKKPGHN
ncbi:MAG: polymer-forming cytoskeletal protein [Chitinophagaceae bacterium]|nr:polymer-forming cytoskeletal protein [Chitinophagaceae bacterium]